MTQRNASVRRGLVRNDSRTIPAGYANHRKNRRRGPLLDPYQDRCERKTGQIEPHTVIIRLKNIPQGRLQATGRKLPLKSLYLIKIQDTPRRRHSAVTGRGRRLNAHQSLLSVLWTHTTEDSMADINTFSPQIHPLQSLR